MKPEEKKQDIQKNVLRFVGLSRSGNHAIIHWILNQLQGDYCFLNCAEPKHNPFVTARPLHEEGGITYETNISSFSLEQEQQGNFTIKDYLLYSHEDCFLGTLNGKVFSENRENWLGSAPVHRDILILRDPFNLFASRIKAGLIRGHYTHHGAKPISILTLRRIYKQHAREFLGKKSALKNKVLINFNRWASDKDYRRFIMESLEIQFSDKGFKDVNRVAGGSSFDGTNHSGQAHKMKVNDRWQKFAEDEEFWALFDTELVELAQEIFGDIPPVKLFFDRKQP